MYYAKAIRTIRAIKGISQKDLSNLLEVNPSYISLIENEKRIPSTEILEKISKRLSIPMYLLILLASDKSDLKGISSNDASKLADNLLHIMVNSQNEYKQDIKTPQ